jgi:hypothetical protein
MAMGLSGHILGDVKLRRLTRITGVLFDRAYNRNGFGEGRVIEGEECVHYAINFDTFEVIRIEDARHWYSCTKRPVTTL